MPYGSLFTLQRYGPAVGAVIMEAVTNIVSEARGSARCGVVMERVGDVPFARGSRLRGAPVTMTAAFELHQAIAKGTARCGVLMGFVGLTQADVTSGVLEAEVAPGLTLKQALLDARKAAKIGAYK